MSWGGRGGYWGIRTGAVRGLKSEEGRGVKDGEESNLSQRQCGAGSTSVRLSAWASARASRSANRKRLGGERQEQLGLGAGMYLRVRY